MSYLGPHIKAVLFDLDYTLVSTREVKWAAHKHIAKTLYGKHLTDDEILRHWGKPLRELVCILYGDADADRALRHEASVYDIFPKKLFDGTIEVLENLRQAGKKLGVITAHTRKGLVYDLETLGIPSSLFDYTQTQDDTDFHKPDPRVFEPTILWLDQNNIGPTEAVYIGDALHDMKAAIGAGMGFIGVGTGLVSPDEFQRSDVKAMKQLTELLN